MAVQDDQTKWRMVFSYDPTYLHATTYPFEGAEHTVVQPADVRGIWPAPDSTIIHADGVQSGSGQNDIYTVPVGKLLFINSAQITLRILSDTDVNGRLAVRNAANAHQFYIFYLYIVVEGSKNLTENYSPAIQVPAEWKVYLTTTYAAVAVRALIHGWLEDA